MDLHSKGREADDDAKHPIALPSHSLYLIRISTTSWRSRTKKPSQPSSQCSPHRDTHNTSWTPSSVISADTWKIASNAFYPTEMDRQTRWFESYPSCPSLMELPPPLLPHPLLLVIILMFHYLTLSVQMKNWHDSSPHKNNKILSAAAAGELLLIIIIMYEPPRIMPQQQQHDDSNYSHNVVPWHLLLLHPNHLLATPLLLYSHHLRQQRGGEQWPLYHMIFYVSLVNRTPPPLLLLPPLPIIQIAVAAVQLSTRTEWQTNN